MSATDNHPTDPARDLIDQLSSMPTIQDIPRLFGITWDTLPSNIRDEFVLRIAHQMVGFAGTDMAATVHNCPRLDPEQTMHRFHRHSIEYLELASQIEKTVGALEGIRLEAAFQGAQP